MHAQVCPVCLGKGTVPDELGMGSTATVTKICPACKGVCYIFVPDEYPYWPEPYYPPSPFTPYYFDPGTVWCFSW